MVHINNKNQLINRVSKMLKPILRFLHKKSSRATVNESACCSADYGAENAANEALEARMRQEATTLATVTVIISPWYMGAADRDILPSPTCHMGAQTPEQQCPSPAATVRLDDQEWW